MSQASSAVSGKRGGLGFDDAREFAANEEGIIDRIRGGLEFANRDALPGAQIEVRTRLHEPPGFGKTPADQKPA
ncbi:MAG: hypothetical protein ACREFO_14160 [Acetobacteraceae bacterium]